MAASLWRLRGTAPTTTRPSSRSAVEALLAQAGANAAQLSGITTIIGPGGFSALRVGLGFAKGLAESLDIPIAPVSALEVEAARHFDAGVGPLCPLLEVGRDRVAWCVYEFEGEQLATLHRRAGHDRRSHG